MVARLAFVVALALMGWAYLPHPDPPALPLPVVEVSLSLSDDGTRLAYAAQRGALRQGRVAGRREEFTESEAFTDVCWLELGGATTTIAGNGSSSQVCLARDGRRLAFASEASDLVPGDDNACSDVFVVDLPAGAPRRVAAARERTGMCSSFDPALGGKGRVACTSYAYGNERRLVVDGRPLDLGSRQGPPLGPPSFAPDGLSLAVSAYGHLQEASGTRQQAAITLLELPQHEVARRLPLTPENADGPSYSPTLAAGACAFTSAASNLVAGDTNGRFDVFVRDLESGALECPSLGGADDAVEPCLSSDGRWLAWTAFRGRSPSVVTLYDRQRRRAEVLGEGWKPMVAAGGRRVAWLTPAGRIALWEKGAPLRDLP